MKKIFSLLFVFFTALICVGQKAVLVIPFDVKMYNNQESEKICKYSDVSYDKSIEKIRTSLDLHIYAALKDSMNVSSLLRTYTTDATTDLEVVHHNANYYFSDAKNASDINKPLKKGLQNQNIIAGEVISTKSEVGDKIVNVKLQDPQLFTDLIQTYQAQYILYITQFELLGDFSNPYTVADNSYERTIRVNYVIYNSLGKFITGDVATTTFSGKVNDLDQICDIYLPRIAKQIVKRL